MRGRSSTQSGRKTNKGLPSRIGDLDLIRNASIVGWLPYISHDGESTQSFVPRGFESCVRILDAIYSDELGRDLTWIDLGKNIEDFGLINGIEVAVSGSEESRVSGHIVPTKLRKHTLEALETHLGAASPKAAQCWYALWMQDSFFDSVQLAGADFEYKLSSIRNYCLYGGALEAWRSLWPVILPSLWWPGGRSWCVARDVDIRWTYVAGSNQLIDGLVSSDLPCERVDWDEPLS
jgi:hypothetical protein